MGDQSTRHPLARVLRREAPEFLPLIDWEGTERRSLALAWLILGLCSASLIATAISAWVYGDVVGYNLWNRLYFDFLLYAAALVLIVATRVTTSSIKRVNQELGKYPEVALFGRRAPILYLREFAQENPELERPGFEAQAKGWFGMIGMLIVSTDNSLENLLSKAMSGLGPLLCLRDPQQRRPGGGAFRMQAIVATWQTMVRDLLNRSSLVFMHFGSTDAVSWEIEEVIDRSDKPLMVWIEYVVVPEEMRRAGGDYVERFPKSLVPLMRASQITKEDLGPADDDRGFLFLVSADRRVLWERPKAQWKAVSQSIRKLIRKAGLKPQRNPAFRPRNIAGYSLGKALIGLTGVFLIACICAVGAKYLQFSTFAGRDQASMNRAACLSGDLPVCHGGGSERLNDRETFMEHACSRGYAPSCAGVGAQLLNSATTTEARNQALVHLMFACQAGQVSACELIGAEGERLLGEYPQIGVDYLRTACAGDAAVSCFTLSRLLMRGQEAPQDLPEARRLAAEGCMGSVTASCDLADYLLRCGLGGRPDNATATEMRARRERIDNAERQRRLQTQANNYWGAPPEPLSISRGYFFRGCNGIEGAPN